VFGERESPGPLRALWQFLSHYKDSQVLCGQPIVLDEFFAAEPDVPESSRPSPSPDGAMKGDEVLARRLRFRLNGALESEVRVVLGPVRKGSRRIVEEIMRSRRVVREGQEVARELGLDARQLERRARRILREIAADPKPWAISFLKTLVGWMLGRIFDGFELDEAGLERVRDAARRGPVIFVPSHKSHVDYLILSYLVSEHDLVPPHIAAGANLSFFPLGFLFRRCGAFFLRRKFKGDALYSLLFRGYVRRLLREGHNLEFFIEGGRSRSGKLLSPKLGLLSMVVEAALDDDGARARHAQIVPVSIGYEKVIEGKAHAREQAGGAKKKETVRGLVGASRVLLGDYGRLNIQFDEPIAVGPALAELGALVAWDENQIVPAGEDARRAAVQRLGFRIVHGINRVTALTPTALMASVLLSSGRRTVARAMLIDGARFLLSRARAGGGRLAGGLVDENGALAVAAVDHALDFFLRDGDIEVSTVGTAIYDIPDERRARLSFYRNNAIHFFVAEAIVALALLDATVAGAEPVVARSVLRDRSLKLSRLLKLEFVYRPGESFDIGFARTVRDLTAGGVLTDENGRVHGVDLPALELLAGLLRDFVAAYRIVDDVVNALDGSVTPRELVRRATSLGEARAASGTLDRSEACVPATFANAVDLLVERGVLVEDGDHVRRAR
jgi:glycerol-3-phosphate O-acyltransferase